MNRLRPILTALLCLPLTACFEEPVQEHLHLTIRADGSVVATVVHVVAPSERANDNPQLAERLEGSRETLARSLDPWSQRLANLDPLADHQSFESVEGELRRSIHSAVFGSFDAFVPLVEADGLTGNIITAGNTAALDLFPTGGSRATYSQRQDSERRLRDWAARLADYFSAVIALYEHLDGQPDRAVPCLAHVFDKHEGMGETGPLTPIEEEIVLRAKDTMEEVADALLVPDGKAYSLNELVRLVYDPFPVRLTISVDAEILESQGFVSEAGFFERPAVDAWNALRSLEGRWISPDLVTAAAAPVPEDRQPDPDVLQLASVMRRYASPPTSGEVEAAILSALVPEDVLSLRWSVTARREGELHEPTMGWLAVMAAAETAVPD